MEFNREFAEDVREGLSSEPKFLHSKYFYDQKGDDLFRQIMSLDEYYLTDCEMEIIARNEKEFISIFSEGNKPFDLIEFGCGDGSKTKVLLKYFLDNDVSFTYMPVDISSNVLEKLLLDVRKNLPKLKIKPICDDYFHALEELNKVDLNKKVIFFLGSNIGNFRGDNAIPFLKHLNADMREMDQLLIGFDLKKDPDIILKAYNDKKGVTREFNYNLLDRINKELGGDFNRAAFNHYPTYDPVNGEALSYLVSKKVHEVRIEKLGQSFSFDKWEPIFMEVSQKYSLDDIEHLAHHAGFKVKKNFFDRRNYFTDSLWLLK